MTSFENLNRPMEAKMSSSLSIFRRNTPFRTLSRLQSDFETLWEEFSGMESRLSSELEFSPKCELSEESGNYMVKFDMPGVKREDVKIELNENQLTVSAERRHEEKSESKKDHYSEISYGSYERVFSLPTPVDEKKADAKFDNGVLTIMLPKSQSNKAKQIAVH
jgi:HSP20 family protein